MRARVVDNDDLERDLKSGAVINTNTNAYNRALQLRSQRKQLEQERMQVKNELQSLRETCNAIQAQIDELKKLI